MQKNNQIEHVFTTYAKCMQHVTHPPIEWDIKKSMFIFHSKSKTTLFWYFHLFLLFLTMTGTLILFLSEIFGSTPAPQTSLLIMHITISSLFLLPLATVIAVVLYGAQYTAGINSLYTELTKLHGTAGS